MSTLVDSEPMHPVSPRWQVHFVAGQAGSWGSLAKSQWKWLGKGTLSVDQGHLVIDGRRHRPFWFSAKQNIRVRLQQVRNVEATGRMLQFQVTMEDGRTEVTRLRASDARTAQEIAAVLPKARTPEFERAQEEKRSFDQSIEQLGTRPIVTSGLVAANVALFALMASKGGGWFAPRPDVLLHWGTNFGPATLDGEWWRLFTSMFVHFGLVHLVLNMIVLWSMGRLIERMFGSLNYLLLYVFAGTCGSLASIWWQPTVNSAGASGAIFGLLGGLLAFVVNPDTRVPPSIVANLRRSGLVFIGYNLLNGFTHQGIDNACHLGGLAGGFLMGWILAKPLDPAAREEQVSRWALSAALAMAALMAIGWPLAHRPHPRVAAVAFPENPGRHTIAFYPGRYERIVMNSGEAVSSAMQSVHAASDATALDAAIANVRKMVDSGDAEAAFRLGRYYHLESAEPDYASALKYYRIGMEGKHAWATNNLGLLYRDGLGVGRDDQRAYDYFEMASQQKNPWSYSNLAQMTFLGRSVPADAGRAFAWLEQGAANGCSLCLVEEAAVYHSGRYGIRRDTNKTVALLRRASAMGDPEATRAIAELYLVGDGVPQSSAKAFEILKTLSDQGDAEATNTLGELSADKQILDYLFDHSLGGVGQIPADFAKAFPRDLAGANRYWELANRQGSCQSLINLSSVYDRGVGVNADFQRAGSYVKQAVGCDPTNSFYLWKLGMRYYDAKGVAQDCEAAEKLFTQSLDNGYAPATVNLGYIYDKGCGAIARDDPRAFQIYLLGAKLGVPLCQNNVGAMLKHGRGVKAADVARGYGWIKLAALHGDELAEKNLQDPLFTTEVRVVGLADLADIQRRLLADPDDRPAIMSDPWY